MKCPDGKKHSATDKKRRCIINNTRTSCNKIGKELNTSTGRCKIKCKKIATELNTSTGRCRLKCNTNKTRNNNGRCIIKCTRNEVKIGRICRTKCNRNEHRSETTKKCISI